MEKERYCQDLLALLKIMGAGESTIKGLLQFELFKTREAMKNLTKALVRLLYFGLRNSEYILLFDNNATTIFNPYHTYFPTDLIRHNHPCTIHPHTQTQAHTNEQHFLIILL